MTTTLMKVEIETETCSVCGGGGDLFTPEEHDAGAPPMQVPLRAMLLHINNNKVVPEGKLCVSCIRRAIEAYEFSTALSTRSVPPLSEKIRALRRRLHELTQKIDVFIVVGGPGVNSGGAYSEDDIIMVERDALAAAAAADDEDLEKARNACGETVYQCSICPMSFQHASEYRAHIVIHPGGARHSCWTCGAQFNSKDALRDHTTLHAAAQELTCNLCSITFQSGAEQRRHEGACAGGRAAHALAQRQAERFVCGYDACILRFANRSDLLAHIRKCHASVGAGAGVEAETEAEAGAGEEAPPVVACAHCDRTFGSVAAMKRHVRVHRKEQPQEEPEWTAEGELEALGGDVEYLELEALDDLDHDQLHH